MKVPSEVHRVKIQSEGRRGEKREAGSELQGPGRGQEESPRPSDSVMEQPQSRDGEQRLRDDTGLTPPGLGCRIGGPRQIEKNQACPLH